MSIIYVGSLAVVVLSVLGALGTIEDIAHDMLGREISYEGALSTPLSHTTGWCGSAGRLSFEHRAKEAGIAGGTYLFVGWCGKTALLVFAATAGLALVPIFGPVAATALVGAGFLA